MIIVAPRLTGYHVRVALETQTEKSRLRDECVEGGAATVRKVEPRSQRPLTDLMPSREQGIAYRVSQ